MCSSKVALIFLSTFVLSYTHKLIPRIVNGDLGSEGQFPYYAYLQMYKSDLTAAYRCGGALITSDFILTVAHCLKDIHHVNIFMGISHLYSSELAMETIIVNSNRLYIHPDYHKALTYKNDIGLIHLPRPVALSYHINPIELPSDCTSNENLDVMVMGFGRPEANEPFSHHLQYAKMKTISFTSCITEHPLLLLSRSIFNTQSQSIICAKPYEEKIQSVNGVILYFLITEFTPSSCIFTEVCTFQYFYYSE